MDDAGAHDTSNVLPPTSPPSEVASTIRMRVIFFTFLRALSPSPIRLRWTPPRWRHTLPPTLSRFRPQGNARTHAYTRRRTTRTQVQRVHHAYIDDDVRGICTWRCAHVRFTDDRTPYSLPLRVEGASDSSSLESARIYGRDDMTATCEILRPMESPRQRTATSHSGEGE